MSNLSYITDDKSVYRFCFCKPLIYNILQMSIFSKTHTENINKYADVIPFQFLVICHLTYGFIIRIYFIQIDYIFWYLIIV